MCLFIARDSPPMAGIFAARAFEAAERLEAYPRSGRVVPEVDVDWIRELILGSYRLIYRHREGEQVVAILSLYHAARRLEQEQYFSGK